MSVILLAIVLLLAGAYVVGYWIASNSESYKVAQKIIYENPLLNNQVGQIIKLRLSFLGYSVRYTGPHGYAEYKILVTGEKDKGVVYLNLEKSAGIWEVIKGNLVLEDGVSISIMPTPSSASP